MASRKPNLRLTKIISRFVTIHITLLQLILRMSHLEQKQNNFSNLFRILLLC